MKNIEDQIRNQLKQNEADFSGAQDLIDAHLDDVAGGAFSLHVQFGNKKEQVE